MTKPIRYKKEYCKQMLKFFSIEHTIEGYEITTDKNGEKIKTVEKPNPLPTFEKFAVSIGTCSKIFDKWCKEHAEFEHTYALCKELQKDMLNDLGMRGFYNPTYTIFVAKNITDMKDKFEASQENFDDFKEEYLIAMKKLSDTNSTERKNNGKQ